MTSHPPRRPRLRRLAALGLTAVLAGSGLAACGSSDESSTATGAGQTRTTLRAGVYDAAPQIFVFEQAKKYLAEKGIDLKLTKSTDFNVLFNSLNQGELDVVGPFQPTWQASVAKENGYDFVSGEPVYAGTYLLASEKHDSIESIPDGAKIAIPSDPGNDTIALRSLASLGLIELDPKVDADKQTLKTIGNPHNFDFVSIEGVNIPRSLPDVDAGIATTTLFAESGITAQDKKALAAIPMAEENWGAPGYRADKYTSGELDDLIAALTDKRLAAAVDGDPNLAGTVVSVPKAREQLASAS